MKGILLAGGANTRLHPITYAISKQLLPVYDKPMVYYPLSTLMLAGIKDIALISSPDALPLYEKTLGNGNQWGIQITYIEQSKPRGIAEALVLAKDFINHQPCCLILGDNIFYADQLPSLLKQASTLKNGALVFAYRVNDPSRFGVVEFDKQWRVQSIEEKPQQPKSNYAVTGLYFYDEKASDYASQLTPSKRGELEITDLNKRYMEKQQLRSLVLGRGTAWLDTGTPESLIEASQFIHIIEKRQGKKIACLEEIALNQGYISKQDLKEHLQTLSDCSYTSYIKKLLNESAVLREIA